MKKVAIVKGLQTEKLKVPVPLWLERSGEVVKVEVSKFLIQYLQVDCASDELRKIFLVPEIGVFLSDTNGPRLDKLESLIAEIIQQQPRADIGIVRFLLDERARRHRLR